MSELWEMQAKQRLASSGLCYYRLVLGSRQRFPKEEKVLLVTYYYVCIQNHNRQDPKSINE